MGVLKFGRINDMEEGWICGKDQPLWHRKVYQMWSSMWRRVYTDINYFGKTIQFEYKYLSKYVNDIMKLENFEAFKENPKGWSIDKDIKGGTLDGYYFEYLSLVTRSDNGRDTINRNGTALSEFRFNPRRPIIAISPKSKILFKYLRQATDKGFDISCVCKCLKGERKLHKGYKWKYINYTHNKIYRIKGGN